MKKGWIGCLLFFAAFINTNAQNGLEYMPFDSLYNGIQKNKEILILNFWATWCKPCVMELPEFEKIHTDFNTKGVKVVLANMDLHSKTESTVPPFMIKNNIQSHVVHITNTDPNDFINTIDPAWSGALPATAIYYQGKKVWFHEGETSYEELKSILIKYIQQ